MKKMEQSEWSCILAKILNCLNVKCRSPMDFSTKTKFTSIDLQPHCTRQKVYFRPICFRCRCLSVFPENMPSFVVSINFQFIPFFSFNLHLMSYYMLGTIKCSLGVKHNMYYSNRISYQYNHRQDKTI